MPYKKKWHGRARYIARSGTDGKDWARSRHGYYTGNFSIENVLPGNASFEHGIMHGHGNDTVSTRTSRAPQGLMHGLTDTE